MQTDLNEIQLRLRQILATQGPALKIAKDSPGTLEVTGTKRVPYGAKGDLVDGYYFASVVPKPTDVRWYFFPIYQHPAEFQLSDDLRKCLKGKSCFHIKKLSPEMEQEINGMMKKGIELFQNDGLI